MKKRIIAILLAVTALVTFLAVPVSALNAGVDEELGKIDGDFYNQYPFFNMFPLVYEWIEGHHGGVYLTVSPEGVITVIGKVEKPSEGNVNYYDIVLFDYDSYPKGIQLPNGNVTFSTNIVEDNAYMFLVLDNGKKVNVSSESVSFWGGGRSIKEVVLRLRFDGKNDDMEIKPTLNAGSVAYPFTPYSTTEKIITQYYDAGYGWGVGEGIRQGYEDGVFAGLGKNECVWHEGDYMNDVIYKSYYDVGYNSIKNDPWATEEQKQHFARGYADGYYFDWRDFHYSCCADRDYYYAMGYQGKSVAEANLNGYDYGYGVGYDDGYSQGDSDGHDRGYNEGYGLGVDYGEQQEVSKNLIGVVDAIATAPASAVGEMFNFEFFGVNVAKLIFRIFTALIILLLVGLVIKFIF